MASKDELVVGDYVRWRGDDGYLFGTVKELKITPLGNQEAYVSPDGAGEDVHVSKLVNDLLRIPGGN